MPSRRRSGTRRPDDLSFDHNTCSRAGAKTSVQEVILLLRGSGDGRHEILHYEPSSAVQSAPRHYLSSVVSRAITPRSLCTKGSKPKRQSGLHQFMHLVQRFNSQCQTSEGFRSCSIQPGQ